MRKRSIRGQKVVHGNYHGPLADPITETPAMELELGLRGVVVIQRLGGVIRITTGHRVKRTLTESLMLGGTVLLPVDQLSEVLRAIRKAARKKVPHY